jgi:hypothetical protein
MEVGDVMAMAVDALVGIGGSGVAVGGATGSVGLHAGNRNKTDKIKARLLVFIVYPFH